MTVQAVQNAANMQISEVALQDHNALTIAKAAFMASQNIDAPATVSTEELLMLFANASAAHEATENSLKGMIQAGINSKNLLTTVANAANGVAPDNVQPLKDAINDAMTKTKDPAVLKALQEALNQTKIGDNDNVMSPEEISKVKELMSNTSATIDSDVQMKTLQLKQEDDRFSNITSLVKEIMDNNKKILDIINQR